MKLIYFNAATQSAVRDVLPALTVYLGNGYLTLNKGLLKVLKVSAGDRISLVQDQDRPADWYIVVDPAGMTLRGKNALVVSNSSCAHKIATSIGAGDAKRIIIRTGPPIEMDGKDLFPLITKAAVVKR